MTGTMDGAQEPARKQRSFLLIVVGIVALACGIVIGLAWRSDGDPDQWRTGRGYVGAEQVSVRSQGWTYGADAAAAVPWIDADGTWHEGGWPGCLRRFKTQQVRFQARSVTIDGNTWRPIVAIDCR